MKNHQHLSRTSQVFILISQVFSQVSQVSRFTKHFSSSFQIIFLAFNISVKIYDVWWNRFYFGKGLDTFREELIKENFDDAISIK